VGGEQQQSVGGDHRDGEDAGHLLDEVGQQPVQVAGLTAQSEGTGRGQLLASSTVPPVASSVAAAPVPPVSRARAGCGAAADGARWGPVCSEISASTSRYPASAPRWKPPRRRRRASASTEPVRGRGASAGARSEEHTSELQSRDNL